jgi:hypothetical protein
MQITSKTALSALGLVAIGTVANVWTYLTPAVASSAREQQSIRDEMKYIRDRVDEVHEAVGAKTRENLNG